MSRLQSWKQWNGVKVGFLCPTWNELNAQVQRYEGLFCCAPHAGMSLHPPLPPTERPRGSRSELYSVECVSFCIIFPFFRHQRHTDQYRTSFCCLPIFSRSTVKHVPWLDLSSYITNGCGLASSCPASSALTPINMASSISSDDSEQGSMLFSLWGLGTSVP